MRQNSSISVSSFIRFFFCFVSMVKFFSSVWPLLILLLESDYVCLSIDINALQDTGIDSDTEVIFSDCKIVAGHCLLDFRHIMKLVQLWRNCFWFLLLIFYVDTHKNRDLLFSCESPLGWNVGKIKEFCSSRLHSFTTGNYVNTTLASFVYKLLSN